MTKHALQWIVVLGGIASTSVTSAATTTFGYDALGRLVRVDVSGGALDGTRQGYRYDAAGNRLESRILTPGPTSVTPASTTLNAIQDDVLLRVNVGDATTGGTVSFYFNDVLLGSGPVINGMVEIVFEGMARGNYSVRAVYSGDPFHDPNTVTFNVRVVNLSWLPSVLDLILQ